MLKSTQTVTALPPLILTPTMERFVLHWGEMGTRWGVNRSVAQIHALLLLWPEPLPADQIAETLSMARSNVSTSLKELQSWQLIQVVHQMGDRRDHFVAKQDLWEVLMTITDQRKAREIDPTLTMLRASVAGAEDDTTTPPQVYERIAEFEQFLSSLDGWYTQMRQVPPSNLQRLIQFGSKIVAFLPGVTRKK